MQTITRVFDSYAQAEAAVEAARNAGVDNDEISILANSNHPDSERLGTLRDETSGTATGAGVGAAVGGGAGLIAGLGLMAIPGLGPLVAAGWFASTAAGAAAGAAAGGLIGMLSSSGIEGEEADVYAEAVRRGSIVVAVRAEDDQASRVTQALDQNSPSDMTSRTESWRAEGWSGYDPDAPLYRPEDIRAERGNPSGSQI